MSKRMEKKFISAVVYLHDDTNRINHFMNTVIKKIHDSFEQFELVLVDDACTDETIEMAREISAALFVDSMVSVVHMGLYQGVEPSMNAGRDVAIGDFVFEFDDTVVDYDSSFLLEVYERVVAGDDIVSARPIGRQYLTSKLFYSLYNRTNKGNMKIGPESFRLVSRRAINRIKSSGKYIPYRKAVYANCGLNMSSVSYTPIPGQTKNKATTKERGTLAIDSFIYFTNILERVSLSVSVLFLVISLGIIVYAIVDHATGQGVVEGWTSTMVVMSVGFFGVFALLTIVLKYLSVMLNLMFKQHKYLVADIEKIR